MRRVIGCAGLVAVLLVGCAVDDGTPGQRVAAQAPPTPSQTPSPTSSPAAEPPPTFAEVFATMPRAAAPFTVQVYDRAIDRSSEAGVDDRAGAVSSWGLHLGAVDATLEGLEERLDPLAVFGYSSERVRADVRGDDEMEYVFPRGGPRNVLEHLRRVEGVDIEESGESLRISGGPCPPQPTWLCINSRWTVVGEALAVSAMGAFPSEGETAADDPDAAAIAAELDAREAVAATVLLEPYTIEDFLVCSPCDQVIYDRVAASPHVPTYLVAAVAATGLDEGIVILRYATPADAEAAAAIAQDVLDQEAQFGSSFILLDRSVEGSQVVWTVRGMSDGPTWPSLAGASRRILRVADAEGSAP